MNLFLPFRRATIERDAAFDQAFREGALDGVPGRCTHCGRRILNRSNMARHIRAKHPNAPNAGPDPVLGDASATLSAPDALGGNIAA